MIPQLGFAPTHIGVWPCCLPGGRVVGDRRISIADVIDLLAGQDRVQPVRNGLIGPAGGEPNQLNGLRRLRPGTRISPATMSALLAATGQSSDALDVDHSASNALQDLFSQIDGNGDGQISKSDSRARSAPEAPIWRRPTTCSASWIPMATAR